MKAKRAISNATNGKVGAADVARDAEWTPVARVEGPIEGGGGIQQI